MRNARKNYRNADCEAQRRQLLCDILVVMLRLEPLIGAFLSLFLTEPVPLLQFAGEFIAAPGYIIEVVIGQIAPPLFDRTLDLLPLSFDLSPVHGDPPHRLDAVLLAIRR